MHDLVCAKDDIEALWQSWGEPDIWRLPTGHVAICCGFVTGLSGRVLLWLAPRLNRQGTTSTYFHVVPFLSLRIWDWPRHAPQASTL
jgi:hypothetical protein